MHKRQNRLDFPNHFRNRSSSLQSLHPHYGTAYSLSRYKTVCRAHLYKPSLLFDNRASKKPVQNQSLRNILLRCLKAEIPHTFSGYPPSLFPLYLPAAPVGIHRPALIKHSLLFLVPDAEHDTLLV